jgi:hypothetical protein
MSNHRNWGIPRKIYVPPPQRTKIRHWFWDTVAAGIGIITIGIMFLIIASIASSL